MDDHNTAPHRWKLGVMGGTFNPVHIGHLAMASECMGALGLDEVVFVPTGIPSHKNAADVLPAEHRLAMVQLAVAGNPRFTVSRADIDRGTPTYTVDTLTDLRTERGNDVELYFITGADVVAQIPTWNRSEGLFELAHFVGVSRSGVEPDISALPADRVSVCSLPELAMSSTEIRSRVRENRPVWYWLPETVMTYIGKHRLYGASWGYGAEPA